MSDFKAKVDKGRQENIIDGYDLGDRNRRPAVWNLVYVMLSKAEIGSLIVQTAIMQKLFELQNQTSVLLVYLL